MESTTELLAGMLPSVVVIGGLLLALRHLARRPALRRSGGMRVVERTGVSRGALVAIVEADERRFLVGVTEHGVNLLSELEPRTETVAVPIPDLPGPRTDAAFPTHLDRPRSGLVHRLQQMTVRTHLEAPLRELT